jgi:hypothetical protein
MALFRATTCWLKDNNEKLNHKTSFKVSFFEVPSIILAEEDIYNKVPKFNHVCRTIRRTLKGRARKDSQITQ